MLDWKKILFMIRTIREALEEPNKETLIKDINFLQAQNAKRLTIEETSRKPSSQVDKCTIFIVSKIYFF